jgi:hypothetical protein
MSKFIDKAAHAFMTIEDAANSAHANSDSTRMYFNILGSHHSHLKAVNSAYAAIRTYLYENTLPFSQSGDGQQTRGPRLIPVCRVPEVLTKLQELKHEAETALNEFLPEYARLVELARIHDVGDFGAEIHYPAADEVRGRFVARVSAPQAIPSANMAGFSLPAKMADDIAAANSAAIAAQLDRAKNTAMQQAEDQMKTLVKQLRDGKRLHPSLISNSRRAGRMLRDITEGYDNDPRLLALADLIDEKIGSVESTETWKTLPSARKKSLRAAETIHKGLRDLNKAENPATVDTTVKADNVVAGGMLADLLS